MISKRNKIFITLCLAILICSGWQGSNVFAADVNDLKSHKIENSELKQSGDYLYQYCPICQGIVIVGYTGKDKVVIVPEMIDGIRVKELGRSAFNYVDTMEECILPEGIMLSGGCFDGCSNLKKVKIPEGVTYLLGTFFMCRSLEEVSLPSTLVDIGESTFAHCTSLKTLEIPDSVQNIGITAFAGCSNLRKIKLPSQLREIETMAFEECKKLKEIEIPDRVSYIGLQAFCGCTALQKVTLPKNLTSLDAGTFIRCESLREITLPASLKYIGVNAFAGCKKLKKIVLKGSKLQRVDRGAFKGIHKKAVFDAPQKAVKAYKVLINKKTGYRKSTMKIK